MIHARYNGGKYASIVPKGDIGVPVKKHGKKGCQAFSVIWESGFKTAQLSEDLEFLKGYQVDSPQPEGS